MAHPAAQRASALLHAGQHAEAQRVLAEALRRSPADTQLHYLQGFATAAGGDDARAIYHMEQCCALAPQHALFHACLGELQIKRGRFDLAVKPLETAARLDPTSHATLIMLGTLHVARREYDQAEARYRQALGVAPADSKTTSNLANVFLETARADEACTLLREADARTPGRLPLALALCSTLNYVEAPTSEIVEAHRRFGALAEAISGPRVPRPTADTSPNRALKLGILSSDLRTHSVAYFVEPLLAGLDPAVCVPWVYSTTSHADDTTARLRALCPRWREVGSLDATAVATAIRADGIDILLDLNGLTGSHAVDVLLKRPAPVQLTYLGYPNSTGLSVVDGRIVDEITDPTPEADALATERLLRMDRVFLCYTPDRETLTTPAPARVPDRPVTFGSFNVIPKLSPRTMDLWAAVLRAVPGSRMLLKARSLSSPGLRERLTHSFASRGIPADRLELIPYVDSHREHLGLYQRVDIALDPTPYNGTTTTCEALIMGTPVVTLQGDRHASRVGASILRSVGLSELVAQNDAEYVSIATRLAADGARRSQLSAALRERMLTSPLCDAAGFARSFERVLRDAWAAFATAAG